ncbi:MAG: helix-turn-helix domain-containing protein [Bacteroidales bacterium]|jgi:transposase|nr:helix-turn-helix domain-containing protein [Bacteroidales bacterium]
MSYRVNLTPAQESDLRKIARAHQTQKNILKRVYCILLKHEGQKNENITQLLGIHEDSIADWTKIYLQKGVEGLLKFRYSRRRRSKLHPYRHQIKRMASARRVKTIEQLRRKVKEKYDLELEYSWFFRYCRKYGIYKILKEKAE